MPSRSAYACSAPQCPGLVRAGVCSVCGPVRAQRSSHYDRERGSSAARGYGGRWQSVRRMFLRSSPVCVDCKAQGAVTAATEAHHVIARRNGGSDEESNLLALCKACHSRRTAAGE
jgi:5-methylcytosine-specific restriction protein A